MKSQAKTVEAYLKGLREDERTAISKARQVILDNLPKGFEEVMSYGMIGYVVPHSKYPAGYHVNPRLPLPFMHLGAQKNGIAVYHMVIYAMPDLLQWFQKEYAKTVPTKLDMGKSCIRFKKLDTIPFDLIGKLVKKISVKKWIEAYEKATRRP
jgi:hypothetical protein